MKFALRSILAFALLLPTLAFANTHIDISNHGGKLTVTTAGIEITGSTITAISGPPLGLIVGHLGSYSFSTGALLTGTVQGGGTFAGGALLIHTNGTDKLPKGDFVSATFAGPVTWTMVTLPDGTHNYVITGTMSAVTFNGITVDAVTVQLTVNSGKNTFTGSTNLSGGSTNITGKGISETP